MLSRNKFRFDQNHVDDILTRLIARCIVPGKEEITDDMPDPKDVVFYQVVMAGRRDREAYLVTGNLKHFPSQPFVVTPREMLDLLEKARDASAI